MDNKQSLMNKQIAGLFDRFYSIALRDKINDPLIHSEWNYFQSMLASTNFERDRINMYLSILDNERRKKDKDKDHSSVSEFDVTPAPQSYAYEPRLEKRFSEPPLKPDLHDPYRPELQAEPSTKMMTPKSKYLTKKYPSFDTKENNPAAALSSSSKHKGKEDRPDYRKLSEVAHRLLAMYELSALD